MNYQEKPLVFKYGDCRLIGIAAIPETSSPIGVIIVVGGPQYRSGSHRQFTLLARDLANDGISSLRFDYRGMGDSEGSQRNFETVDDDIRAAIEAMLETIPGVRQIVIWGLCDAASAALYYAHTDPRVSGLVLLNPWVHSEAGAGRARLKHYYLARFLQRSFWIKLFSGKVKAFASIAELLQGIRYYFAGKATPPTSPTPLSVERYSSYIDRMLAGFKRYQGPVLFILSGNDLTSQEFQDLTQTNDAWKTAYSSGRVGQCLLPDANHTFATRLHRDQASLLTRQWLQRSFGKAAPA
jgi:exosortase A-associated hydrolase 1